MIKDIVENKVAAPKPPSAPKAQTQPSLWKRQARGPKSGAARGSPTASAPAAASAKKPAGTSNTSTNKEANMPPMSEDEQIHLENLKKMSQMSPEEIERERQELIASMDAGVLASLLKRAEIKEMSQREWEGVGTPASPASASASGASASSANEAEAGDSVAQVVAPEVAPAKPQPPKEGCVPDQHAEVRPAETEKSSTQSKHEAKSTLHFPPAPEDLKKYFPDTPVETSKLAWMEPVAPEEELEYSEELASMAPSQLRFDFKGNLLTPRVSQQIDTSLGLHHHADAPGAAGYTIPELAHLARSSHASQRSLAIQTVGRVLHKLVNGKFNKSSELQYALEKLVQSTRIEETLLEAASEKTRSMTVRTHATEALWLYHNKQTGS